MLEIWAGIKTIYGIIKMVKQVVELVKDIYGMQLDSERDKRIKLSKETAKAIKKEISKTVAEQDNDKLRELLRAKLKRG